MVYLPSFIPDTDPPEFSTGQTKLARPYFLFVGRLEIIKGLQDVIPLFHNDMPADLWVVGAGEYESALRKMSAGSKRIRFLGKISPEKLRTLFTQAAAVIVPSLCYEVFPLVVLEAFRDRTPIIARNLGPFPEIIRQSNGGLLFETLEDLKTALLQMLNDQRFRRDAGLSGRNAYEQRWSEYTSMKKYFEVIKNIARRRGFQQVLDALE